VVPWLLACRALVHNGCTTGVEAFLLDTPTVAYQPVRSERFDADLPNALSQRASDPEQAVALLREMLSGERGPLAKEQATWVGRHIAAMDGPLACERIMDRVQALRDGDPARRPALDERLGGWLEAQRRAASKRLNALVPGHKNSPRYQRHRFPGISSEAVHERIARLQTLLDRFHDVQVRPYGRHVFRIAPRGH
jgi:hypothetical protein